MKRFAEALSGLRRRSANAAAKARRFCSLCLALARPSSPAAKLVWSRAARTPAPALSALFGLSAQSARRLLFAAAVCCAYPAFLFAKLCAPYLSDEPRVYMVMPISASALAGDGQTPLEYPAEAASLSKLTKSTSAELLRLTFRARSLPEPLAALSYPAWKETSEALAQSHAENLSSGLLALRIAEAQKALAAARRAALGPAGRSAWLLNPSDPRFADPNIACAANPSGPALPGRFFDAARNQCLLDFSEALGSARAGAKAGSAAFMALLALLLLGRLAMYLADNLEAISSVGQAQFQALSDENALQKAIAAAKGASPPPGAAPRKGRRL